MILFFDTETTGIGPRGNKFNPANLDEWPRMVQLAYALDDETHTETVSRNWIIKPEGFVIDEWVAEIHGITTERALAEGVPLVEALEDFYQYFLAADLIVAHNYSFDYGVLGSEMLRGGWQNVLDSKPYCCTMRASTKYCAIPQRNGRGIKWPNLTELHTKLFGCGFKGAHDASNDVAAGLNCYWELRKRRLI
jgi:DNA polymerase-3 subunit epsilon